MEKMLKSFLFKAMSESDLEVIRNALEPYVFNEGENIITQGNEGHVLFLLESGEAEVYRRSVIFYQL